MDGAIALPRDAMNATKCALCNNYLSVPPITAISTDGVQHKCGRCRDVQCTTFARNVCFENVAKFMTFPCTYNRCKELVQWGKVEEHERACLSRTMACPVNQPCGQMIEVSKLLSHFEEKHPQNVRRGKMCGNIEMNQVVMFLLVQNGQQFLIYYFYENNYNQWGIHRQSLVGVFSLVPQRGRGSCKYSVKLSSSGKKSVLYKNYNVVFYDERQHCINCYQSNCSIKYHPHSRLYNMQAVGVPNDFIPLKVPSIMDLLDRPTSVTFEISLELISEETGKTSLEAKAMPNPLKPEPLTIRQGDIECPICQNYMTAPIYTCTTGHTICNDCKTKVKSCPSCKEQIGASRSFGLETIVENIDVPCVFRDRGCAFTGKIQQVLEHQKECSVAE